MAAPAMYRAVTTALCSQRVYICQVEREREWQIRGPYTVSEYHQAALTTPFAPHCLHTQLSTSSKSGFPSLQASKPRPFSQASATADRLLPHCWQQQTDLCCLRKPAKQPGLRCQSVVHCKHFFRPSWSCSTRCHRCSLDGLGRLWHTCDPWGDGWDQCHHCQDLCKLRLRSAPMCLRYSIAMFPMGSASTTYSGANLCIMLLQHIRSCMLVLLKEGGCVPCIQGCQLAESCDLHHPPAHEQSGIACLRHRNRHPVFATLLVYYSCPQNVSARFILSQTPVQTQLGSA